MTPRNTIGDNFKGAVNYQYTGRLSAPSDKQPLILFAEGVRTDNAQVMGADFEWGCTLNPNVSNPVWHTSISFNPDDTEKLTNEKMLAVAQDFRKEMGLLGTQCVIIRHFDKEDNQHLHILVNRVADDGHSIPDGRNFYRSKLAVAKLCEAHGLTPAAGQRPELQHPERIVGAYDKAGAEIRQAIAYGLQTACERASLWQELWKKDITATESSRGVTFTKDGFTFSGTQIAKGYGLGGIDRQLVTNRVAREEQQRAEAREHERVRFQAQQVLTGLVDPKAFASHAEFRAQVATQGYTFVIGPAGEAQLRHEASARQFDLTQVQPGGVTARPLWEQVEAIVLEKAAEERARQAARREAVRQETEHALTQTRDSGLSRPDQFFYRLRAQPYDLISDPQTRQLTHVRHRGSGEVFAYAEVQPGGLGAPPLAEQLATACQAAPQPAGSRQSLSSWAQGRAQVEEVITQVRQEPRFFNRKELQACLQAAGVTLLPPSAVGHPELFRLDATGQLFREKEVLRAGSVADLLAEAAARRATRRQAVEEQTRRDVKQTLHAPESPLTGVKNYQQQLEAHGYELRQVPGQPMKIQHLISGEQFELTEVQPGGPTAAPLIDQVRAVVAQQKQQAETLAQATKALEQVLEAKKIFTWSHYEAQLEAQGYQAITGLDGQARLLHVASRQHVALEEVRPHGRDLLTQVKEVLAACQPELVQGQIEVLPTSEWASAQRVASMQKLLVDAGAWTDVTAGPAAGGGESVVLTYTHLAKGAQLDEVNKGLYTMQTLSGVTVREQPKSGDQPAAEWPLRYGEYGQVTLVCTTQAYRNAAAGGVSMATQLAQTGAAVRELPGAPTGTLQLEVSYHTQRTAVPMLTLLLDRWASEVSDFKVQETEQACQARGGQTPQAEQTIQYGR
jgi:hypothetical protein